ncbi:MAG: hypothetical protein IT262_21400 [Saprospiraceae bacterium]|nr:hypothetical protein [Saprospiraceae bacterium]
MNWQEFEDNLKGYVGEQETLVDTDALWANIQRKKRRRILLFWWFFGCVCLLGGIGWFTRSVSGKTRESGNVAPKIEIVDATRTPETARTGKKSAAPVSADNKSETNVAALPGIPSTTEQPDSRNSRNTNIKSPSAGRQVKIRSAKFEKVQPVPENSIPVTKEIASSSENIFHEALDPKQPDAAGYSLPNRISAYPFRVTPPFVHSIAELVLDLTVFPDKSAPFVSAIKPTKPSFRIGIQTGIAYWGKIQEPANDPVLPRTNEQLLEALNLGIHYQKPVGKHWAFRAGIQYVRYNSVFNWQTSWVTAGQNQQVLNYYTNGRVDTSYLPGALIESTRTVRRHNQNNSLTLPVDVQFRIPFRRSVLTTFLGIQPGFLQTANGAILDGSNRPDYAIYSKVYGRRFGLGLRAGLALELPLHKQFSLLLEPACSMDLTPRTARNAPGPERFWQFGMNVGIVRSIQ